MTEPSTPTAALKTTDWGVLALALVVLALVGALVVLLVTGTDPRPYLSFLTAPVVATLLAGLVRATLTH